MTYSPPVPSFVLQIDIGLGGSLIRRLRLRSWARSSSLQWLKISISALLIFSIISWPIFLHADLEASGVHQTHDLQRIQLAGRLLVLVQRLDHPSIPLYSMMTCLAVLLLQLE